MTRSFSARRSYGARRTRNKAGPEGVGEIIDPFRIRNGRGALKLDGGIAAIEEYPRHAMWLDQGGDHRLGRLIANRQGLRFPAALEALVGSSRRVRVGDLGRVCTEQGRP
jgi:hypothetical protein